MKVDTSRIQQLYKAWPADLRLVLFHGPDTPTSRDHADQIARQFADPANPMAVETLTGATLASDPQALAAAAGTVSMFGDRTLIRIDGLDDDGLDAITRLLAGPAGNPVIAIAGTLKKTSKLLQLAEKSAAVAALQSYEPSARDAVRLAVDIGTPLGLRPSRDAAAALFEAAAGDRTLMRRELEKLALYLDADTDRPQPLELADVAAIGVGAGDSDQYALVAAIAGGRPREVVSHLARLPHGLAIVVVRAVERRFVTLLGLRGVVDGGASPATAVKGARPPVFWKEQDAIAAELGLWTTPALVRGLADLLAAERAIKSPRSLGDTLALTTLVTLSRRAASRR